MSNWPDSSRSHNERRSEQRAQSDPWAETRPASITHVEHYPPQPQPPDWMRPRRRRGCGCSSCGGSLFGILTLLLLIGLAYFLAPLRTNILFLGIDYAPPGSAVARSDTIVLTTIIPTRPYVGALSIPRDLWVMIPDVGENRINTAHFFAEAQRAGAGPPAAMEAVAQNFGVNLDYYIRINFDGVRTIVDAMGGLDIELDEAMAGYPPGRHHLTGNKALAFARDRAGSDDFFRMQHGQFLLRAILKQMIRPATLPRLPGVLRAIADATDTNIPIWQWPRLGLAVLRAGPEGIDGRTIDRTMVTPFITNQGAAVLLPRWEMINPVLFEMFGE